MRIAAGSVISLLNINTLIIAVVLGLFLVVSIVFYIFAIVSQNKQIKSGKEKEHMEIEKFNLLKTDYEQEIGKVKKVYKNN